MVVTGRWRRWLGGVGGVVMRCGCGGRGDEVEMDEGDVGDGSGGGCGCGGDAVDDDVVLPESGRRWPDMGRRKNGG
ncbi:hypothetical protein Tco_0527300 [Tanacetum coccineum]